MRYVLALTVTISVQVAWTHAQSVTARDTTFRLPDEFLGLWNGAPSFSVFGPFIPNSYTFGISMAPNGDYLLQNNILYDGEDSGYQRFYLEGTGSTAGELWYCGKLIHFSDYTEITGDSRLNLFKPLTSAPSSDLSVTFCLDSTNPEVMTNNPFKLGCETCDCANWTFSYNPDTEILLSELSMSGSDGHTHSKHIWAELTKIGPAPIVNDEDMPGHGNDFSCEFEDGGRDSVPVDFYHSTDKENKKDTREGGNHNSLSSAQAISTSALFKSGCPMATRLLRRAATPTSRADTASSKKHSFLKPSNHEFLKRDGEDRQYQHCYVLNDLSDFRLQWTLDQSNQLLHCAISVPANTMVTSDLTPNDNGNSTYVAIGFRPLSRVSDLKLNAMGTGHHNNFGMEGADIVSGSLNHGVRTQYASLYTGPPVVDYSLNISESNVEIGADGRIMLSFTRPLIGGYLDVNYGVQASILTDMADIIWAVGEDDDNDTNSGNLQYHNNFRGLHVIDWENPEIAFYDSWAC